MTSKRKQLVDYIASHELAPDKVPQALQTLELVPRRMDWLKLLDRLLLWSGACSLLVATAFFIAANWGQLSRFSKFAGLEIMLVMVIVAYVQVSRPVLAKLLLLVASMLVGILLAFYGQTYQTGADPWQLFATWAALMLPWVIVSRFSSLWLLWLLVVNLALSLYLGVFRPRWMPNISDIIMLALFCLNITALVVWELRPGAILASTERWSARIIATAAGGCITWLGMEKIFGFDNQSRADDLGFLLWAIWCAVTVYVYRYRRRDLFMLAGAALSFSTLAMSLVARLVFESVDIGGFLVLSLLLIGLGSGSAIWLRNIQRGWQ
ncbi:DUF2157 domain-containing protein [Shewanella sp. NIFS-20-20]|uniref:DUF2157 domain-containing protein n=1 Tax=Shewanella sp. NIFS-20-20 TaxID=2853806 RepID=UPI001C486715|nr:DUF2157 domain-containing protein [Shewanella sp. NIFS-20-20]MBV7315995.1 DUF2157 domain-containing protein [Shewanella sp. NIFS-20-20]